MNPIWSAEESITTRERYIMTTISVFTARHVDGVLGQNAHGFALT